MYYSYKDQISDDSDRVEQSCGFWDFDLAVDRYIFLYLITFINVDLASFVEDGQERVWN